MGISHKVQNAQSNSYTKFQIILFKTDIAPKGFCLVQAGLKWAFWAENQKNIISQCRNYFFNIW